MPVPLVFAGEVSEVGAKLRGGKLAHARAEFQCTATRLQLSNHTAMLIRHRAPATGQMAARSKWTCGERFNTSGLDLVWSHLQLRLSSTHTERDSRTAPKSSRAPLKRKRLEAIATTAEFFRVDVSGLTRAQQQDIALTQIHARARRDLLLAGVSLTIAVLLAAIAIVAILASKSAGTAIVVNPSGPVIAAGRDIIGPLTIGLDEEKVGERVVQAQKPLGDKLEEILAMTARERGVEVAPLRAILIKMGEVGVRDEDVAKRLDEKASELIKLRTDLAKSKQGPAALASFAQQAEALIKNGDLDDARDALTAGRTLARTMRDESSSYEADFLAQEATVDHLQLAYRAAAAKYAEAASLIAALDQQKQWEFVLAQADELNSQGDEFGDNSALRSAIERYRALLDQQPRARVSLDWAKIQTSLGNAYRMLGERENTTALLEQSVLTFREALQEQTRERVPLDWARTQASLGYALWRIGERSQWREANTTLEEAVLAFRAALQEQTREHVPLDWARTQTSLGTALWAIGELNGDSARLEEAVLIFREALVESTRERAPLDWARTQNNLGNALRVLGTLHGDAARLEEAVLALRAAQQELTRDRAPLRWAGSQLSLGIALFLIGKGEIGTARLEEAVASYRDTLKEYTRERVPLYWASVEKNFGEALSELGSRERGTARLEEAVTAFHEALTEFTPEREPFTGNWLSIQNLMGATLSTLAARENNTARLKEAVAAYRAVLNENARARGQAPLDCAMDIGPEGVSLRLQAELSGVLRVASQALAQITAAFESCRDAKSPKANYYKAQLSSARALVKRLRKA